MGVKACSRKGCNNIMCDRYSSTFGYICDECFEELVKSPADIMIFLDTPKSINPFQGVHRRAHLAAIFPKEEEGVIKCSVNT